MCPLFLLQGLGPVQLPEPTSVASAEVTPTKDVTPVTPKLNKTARPTVRSIRIKRFIGFPLISPFTGS